MTDQFAEAASRLTDSQLKAAMHARLEELDSVDPHAGILRQLVHSDGRPLSGKQEYVFEHEIRPTLVERCGRTQCSNFVPAGTDVCPTCEIEY